MHAVVYTADTKDRDGGMLVLSSMFGLYPFLEKLFADGGYQGPQFHKAVAKTLPRPSAEGATQAVGVEGTNAWPNRCRPSGKRFREPNS